MSERRRSATSSSLRPRGRHALPWLRRSWTNRWKVLLAPTILGVALFAYPAFAGTTLYVSTTGSDAVENDCQSPETPCLTIGAAISRATAGDVIDIAAGTYAETVTVDKEVTLDGAGSTGAGATIIDPASGRGIEITAGGSSLSSRVVVKDLKVTDSTDGIYVSDGSDAIGHLTISNVVSTANTSADGSLGNGIHFAGTGSVSDVIITGSTFSSNSGSGIRIASAVPSFDGLSVIGTSAVTGNGKAGFDYNPSGTVANVGTNFTFEDVTFSGNVTKNEANVHEVSLFGFHGNATLRRVTVSGVNAAYGIVFSNNNTFAALGTVVLDDVTVDGTVDKGGLTFQYYNDTPSVTLTDVDLSAVTAPWGQFILHSSDPDLFPLGTTTLRTANVWTTGGIAATSASFKHVTTGAALDKATLADNFQIEDQVGHKTDSGSLGLVRWNAGKIYAAPAAGAYGGIQAAIAAATAGDTVHVRAGTYSETVTVDKGITLAGAKAGLAAGPAASYVNRDFSTFVGESRITSKVTITGTNAVLDGFVVDVSADHSVYAYGSNITVRNTALIGRSNIKTNSGGASGITTQSAGDGVAESYVFEYNRFSGGRYGLNYDGDPGTTSLVFRGNYVTDVERGIQTQGDTAGTVAVTGSLFEDVTVGIRLARDGATITGNSFKSFDGETTTQAAIRFGSETYTICYGGFPAKGITIQNNFMSGMKYGVFVEDPVAAPTSPYTITTNRFSGIVTNTVAVYFNSSISVSGCQSTPVVINSVGPFSLEANTTINAANNYWGSVNGPGASISAAGTTVTTAPFIASYTSAGTEPGFTPSGVVTDSPCSSTCYVSATGSDSGSGTAGNPFLTIGQALTSVNVGGTVSIGAGTFTASAIEVTKSVTLDGAGLTTILDGGASALVIKADDVTVQDLWVKDGTTGISVNWSGQTTDDLLIQDVKISDNTSYGLELGTAATGIDVIRATIERNSVGIKIASAAIINDLFVDESSFADQATGLQIYESNDEADGYVHNLVVEDSAFSQTTLGTSLSAAAVYGEELLDVTFTRNTVEGMLRAFYLFSGYDGAAQATGDVTIEDNVFTDLRYAAVAIEADGDNIDQGISILDNTMDQDVTKTGSTRGPAFDLRLHPVLNNGAPADHAPITISGNEVIFSSSGGSVVVPASFGVMIRGDYDDVTISGNSFDGGGVSGAGSPSSSPWYPVGAGIHIRSSDDYWIAPDAASNLTIERNDITGFGAGILAYDHMFAADGDPYGGLPAGNAIVIRLNDLGGNAVGVLNGTESDFDGIINASGSWWGCASGPGELGCSSTTGRVTVGSFITAYTPDPSKTSAPGFWPLSPQYSLGTIIEPTTVPLAGADLGSPSITIPAATPGTTIDVTAPDPEDLPDSVTPFKVDGATLIDIEVTGTVTFPVTVCLDGTPGTDKLWHYEETSPGIYGWVDMTDREYAPTHLLGANPPGQICGMTMSLSPFALAEEQDAPQECSLAGNTLSVPLTAGESVSVARIGSELWVGSVDVWCGASARQIGATPGKVNILNITGTSGDESVVFLNGTATNWGSNLNGTTTLKRIIALGSGTSDRIVIQGTENADSLAASTFNGYASGVEIYRFEGGEGGDTLTGSAVIDEFIADPGADIMKGGTGNDCADYSAESTAISANLTSGSGGNLTLGYDTYSSIECLKGTTGNDTLIGSTYADWLYGNAGNDTLQGRGGPDALDGGADVDTASYTEQTYPVVVNLTAGTATGTTVGTGGDSIALGTVENVLGGTAGDTLVGNASANALTGNAGADVLVGMAGNDTFDGGTGIDTLSYDDVTYAGAASSGITLSLAVTDPQDTDPGVGSGAGTDTTSGVENLTGSSFGDSFTGDGLVNIINGLGGGDTVSAGLGNDTVNGGSGEDTLNGEAGADTLKGGADADRIDGGVGADSIFGESGDDVLLGGVDGDTLRGGDGDDILVGGATGSGVDVMYGDAHGANGDTISYDDVSYPGAAINPIKFRLSAVGVQQATTGAGTDVVGGGVENLTGSAFADTLVGDAYANVIKGLGGSDIMQGGDGADYLYSGAGTGNKADGQAGSDTCVLSDDGAWAYLQALCETKLP